MKVVIKDYKEPSPYRNLIIIIVVLVIGTMGIFRLYKYGRDKMRKPVVRNKVESIDKKTDNSAKGEIGGQVIDFVKINESLETKIVDFKNFSVDKKETIGTAIRYRQMKENLNENDEDREYRNSKRRYLEKGGNQLLKADRLLKDGRETEALNIIKQTIETGKSEPAVLKEAYRQMAYHYQKKEDMPRYCMNMYNYLEVLEKNPPENQDMDEITQLKGHFRSALEQMKERGLLH